MKYLKIIIRMTLSLTLIYFIYQETGPATAIFAGLMLVVCEIIARFMAVSIEVQNEVLGIITRGES